MDNSPLCKLPPELRNIIYGLMLSRGSIFVHLRNASMDQTLSTINSRGIRQDLALASTCRQIYQETASLYYAINKFVLASNDAVKVFVNLIGEKKASAMQHVEISHFACTRVRDDKPFTSNKAARKHLQSMTALAKRYGWRSVRVSALFMQYPYRPKVSFDLMDAEKTWLDAYSNRTFDIRSAYSRFTGLGLEQFAETVESEIKVWKEILKKLHGQP